jgi:hypothetical protein
VPLLFFFRDGKSDVGANCKRKYTGKLTILKCWFRNELSCQLIGLDYLQEKLLFSAGAKRAIRVED